jgi:hypothetical protein
VRPLNKYQSHDFDCKIEDLYSRTYPYCIYAGVCICRDICILYTLTKKKCERGGECQKNRGTANIRRE